MAEFGSGVFDTASVEHLLLASFLLFIFVAMEMPQLALNVQIFSVVIMIIMSIVFFLGLENEIGAIFTPLDESLHDLSQVAVVFALGIDQIDVIVLFGLEARRLIHALLFALGISEILWL